MRTFVDSNILVYASDRSAGTKHEIAKGLLKELWRTQLGVLSTQVLQEFYVNATRKVQKPISRAEARELIELYSNWQLVSIDHPMIARASLLEEELKLSFWDALILEAARRSGAERMLSEDLQHGRSYQGVIVENPFIG